MHLLLCAKHHELFFVCSSRRKFDKQCHLQGQALQVVDDTKYFGVTLTLGSDATWESHINVVTSKTSSAGIRGLLRKTTEDKSQVCVGNKLTKHLSDHSLRMGTSLQEIHTTL